LKRVAIGRKNWLFAGHDYAGSTAARLYSLIASAERHGVDPQRYLTSVLAKLPFTRNQNSTSSSPTCGSGRTRGKTRRKRGAVTTRPSVPLAGLDDLRPHGEKITPVFRLPRICHPRTTRIRGLREVLGEALPQPR